MFFTQSASFRPQHSVHRRRQASLPPRPRNDARDTSPVVIPEENDPPIQDQVEAFRFCLDRYCLEHIAASWRSDGPWRDREYLRRPHPRAGGQFEIVFGLVVRRHPRNKQTRIRPWNQVVNIDPRAVNTLREVGVTSVLVVVVGLLGVVSSNMISDGVQQLALLN